MERDWIDDGMREERAREAQHARDAEERHRQTARLVTHGPALMQALVAEARAAVDEYRRKAGTSLHDVEFEALPHEGFLVTKHTLPKAAVECRPDYARHQLACDVSRGLDPETDPTEWFFSLTLGVDADGGVTISEGTRVLAGVGDAVAVLLRPVLFPLLDEGHR